MSRGYLAVILAPTPNAPWFSSETLVLYKSLTYLLNSADVRMLDVRDDAVLCSLSAATPRDTHTDTHGGAAAKVS